MNSKRFAIAVSFASEDEAFVSKFVAKLANELGKDRIFYYPWYQHELGGPDGNLKLRQIYLNESEMVVPFFSESYRKKDWCQAEWKVILSRLFQRRKDDLVIPVALDDTEIEGWGPTDISIRKEQQRPGEIATVILKSFRRWEQKLPEPHTPPNESLPAGEKPATPANLPHELESKRKELDKKRQAGVNGLKASVSKILHSQETREFILLRNRLPADLPLEDLATKIFAVVPHYDDDEEEYCTPMCFLRNCDPRDPQAIKPPAAHQSTIYANLWSLAALLAPVSFVLDDDEELTALIRDVTRSAKLEMSKPIVGGAVVASFLGLKLDLDERETIGRGGDWDCTGNVVEGFDKVSTAGVLIPVSNIGDTNIVEDVAKGLAPQLGLREPSVSEVKTELRELAGQRSYVCLWLNRLLDDNSVAELHRAYPHLYVLMSRSKGASDINSLVFRQIERLRKFVGAPV
jgi:hypothetical protein